MDYRSYHERIEKNGNVYAVDVEYSFGNTKYTNSAETKSLSEASARIREFRAAFRDQVSARKDGGNVATQKAVNQVPF